MITTPVTHIAYINHDAIATLINSFGHLNAEDAITTIRQLQYKACTKRDDGDGRTWNLSRQRTTEIMTATGIRPEGCYSDKIMF